MARRATIEFRTREDENNNTAIEGYFAVFNDIYDMGYGITESIAPGAFSDTLAGDVRALINHDTTLVIGRTSAHTLTLSEDAHGLWGSIDINPNDTDAMNQYHRTKRGDVNQCSIGFEIIEEDAEYRDDGTVHFTIRKIKLHEVSCCTFPAYESTGISARAKETRDELDKRSRDAWKARMTRKLKGVKDNGTESTDD